MSDLRRILDEEGDETERALLRAARGYQPPRHLRRSTLVGLGLAGTLGLSKVTAGIAAAYGAVGGKTLVAITLVATVAAGGGTAYHLSKRDERQAAPSVPVRANPAAVEQERPAVAPALPEQPASPPAARPRAMKPVAERRRPILEPPAPEAEPLPVAPAVASPPAPVPPPRADVRSIAEEIRSLDEARKALHSGYAAGAVRLLDRHAQAYPAGSLQPEAAVVRIEALARAGRRAEARALADGFLSARPSSVLSDRVRTLRATLDE